ncbi:MAG: DMT family transporter [Firmicutes bacterium]|nr:DMT family transporter [Bacillota bacterium]
MSIERAERRGGSKALGVFLAMTTAAAFGSLPVLYKVAYAQGATTAGMLAWRFTLGAGLLVWFCKVRGISLRLSPAMVARLACMGAGYAGFSWLYSASLRYVPAWIGTMLFYHYPVTTIVLAYFILGERLDRATVPALLLSLAGCALILWAPGASGMVGSVRQVHVAGALMAIASGVFNALYSVLARKVAAGVHPAVKSVYIACSAASCYVISMLLSGEWWLPRSPGAWASVAALAGWCTAVPMISLLWALEIIGASRTAILSTVEPAVSAALAVAILGERLAWVQALGGALVVLGALLIRRRTTEA